MAETFKVHHSGRTFGNILVDWKIQHANLLRAKPDISPSFEVRGLQKTTWQLSLFPTVNENKETHFVFKISRLDKPDAEIVAVDYDLWLKSFISEDRLAEKTGQHFFKGNTALHISASLFVESIFKHVKPFDPCEMQLYFQFIVSHRKDNTLFELNSDIGLDSLSRDMLALYKRGRCSDVLIKVGDKNIPAHKPVLLTRCPYFQCLFQQDGNNDVINVRTFDYRTVDNVLSYLYSGKLEFVLGKPSIAMQKCIEYFRIDSVEHYFECDRLCLESRVCVTEMCDWWQIDNFQIINGCYRSHIYNETVSQLNIQFFLYPNGKLGNSDSAVISFVALSFKITQKAIRIGIALVDSNNKSVFTSGKCGIVARSDEIEICKLSHEFFLAPNISENGTLKIYIKIQICDMETAWETVGKYIPSAFTHPGELKHSYICLSEDLKLLLKNRLISDVSLVSDGVHFDLHKCILAARSPGLWSQGLLTESNLAYQLPKYIESNIFGILVHYIYTGSLKDINNSSTIDEIKDISERYGMPVLRKNCLKAAKELKCRECD